ncbi:NAD(P)/FAD-dependent oxidoreductase [Christensenellaceae bacterium OttesenSCG-928-K19]|nr:NAD(P)/FAD-dependent oxidoreductase [Christensenellaceae bacterium OttesenSCG-928-K19]
MNSVAVIGGGPAGMMAAFCAARRGLDVTLYEKNEKLGKKLFITGKGRCNLTNAADIAEFFPQIVRNPKFLMSALYGFPNTELLNLLETYGLKTKVERGGRVFPVSDKSSDVIKTMQKILAGEAVKIRLNAKVDSISQKQERFVIDVNGEENVYDACIIATGGLSYPITGSTGDGYKFARALGHAVTKPAPALSAIEDACHVCERMQGLTLKNIEFALFQNNKKVYEERGELLFTHFGISGPVVLSGSSYIDHSKAEELYCTIDFKPALSQEQLEKRILRDFEEHKNKQLLNYMGELLPTKMIVPFLDESHLPGRKPINQVTREERAALIKNLKEFRIKLADVRPIEEAIITAGGVNVREINPSTMESKLVKNLYFAGEVGDYSAQTGGFNLQIAFSTGYLAGDSVLAK